MAEDHNEDPPIRGYYGTAIVEESSTELLCSQPSEIDSFFSIHYIIEQSGCGKWIIFKHLDEIDDTWKAIRTALDEGHLERYISRIKCTTKKYNPTEFGPGPCTKASISVFLSSSEDRIIQDIGHRLIQIVQQDIEYKTTAGTGDIILYWNGGNPSYELMGQEFPGTTIDKVDVWKISVVEASEPFQSREIYGWWEVTLRCDQATEIWHFLKIQIESGGSNPGIIKMECVPKEDPSSPERLRFFIYTSREDREIVGRWLRRHVRTEISYHTND